MGFEPYPPEDFDRFWAEAKEEALKRPLDFHRSRTDFRLEGFSVELFDFKGMEGPLHGWIAVPKEREGRLPAFLWLPAYGRESHPPNEYSTRSGMVSMSFNFHGHVAFHQEGYTPSRGYFAQGVEDPRTWIFRRMAQDSFIAMRALQAQLEADEDRLGVAGLSQGGGMAVWTGAHSPLVKAVVADMPFLAAMRDRIDKEAYRYPPKELVDFAKTIPLGFERIRHTISYFDTVNHAARLNKPTQVGFGERDPAVKPETARAVYDALPGKKRLVAYPGGHDWDPAMIETNRRWLLENT